VSDEADEAADGATVLGADAVVDSETVIGRSEETETVLVTGASSGIGNELAHEFAASGSDVVLVARRVERLREIAAAFEKAYDVSATPVAMDLAVEGAAAELHGTLSDRGVAVDVLVNNAGFAVYGAFAETDGDEEAAMRRLNVETPTRLSKLYAPALRAREGGILNVASLAGIYPTPGAAVYGGTKAYLLSFSEALAEELAPEVQVTALCPGETDTEFVEHGGVEESGLTDAGLLDPETVAEAGYRGFRRGDRVVVPGTRDKVRALLKRVLPRDTATRASRRLWEG
jgi:short-subunit dehydrogenase